MNAHLIEQAASRLRQARLTREPCAPVRELIGQTDLQQAYAVQEAVTGADLDAGRRLVGRKIGLTSLAIQTQLGVDQPDYGMIWADTLFGDSEPVDLSALLHPRAEAEIAFVLDDDLDVDDLTPVDVLGAIAYALPAIEVADSRIRDWDIRITDTIADNASSGVAILGSTPIALADFDPRLCGMVVERRGDPVSVGAGAACLGNPLTAVLWLARKMVAVRRPLRAGDVVLSGALGPMVDVVPGDVLDCRISGLGSVRASFVGAA